MFKFLVRKSVAKDIFKSLGKDKLESLKAEVIAILKKHDSDEFKKAIEYFEGLETKYTHLEKSMTGEWIEKAGYGVGTVRIWKGKKYKKVSSSPVRWVRVFDKMDRGAKSSMTRLIHKAQSCKTEEELYQFCMSNHALFQDDNGVDLPIMEKLRTAINEHKGKLNGSVKVPETKETAKTENKDVKNFSTDQLKAEMAKQVKLHGNRDKEYYDSLVKEYQKRQNDIKAAKYTEDNKIDVSTFPLGKIGQKINGEYPKFNREQGIEIAKRVIDKYGETDKAKQLLEKLTDFNNQMAANGYEGAFDFYDSWDGIKKEIGQLTKEHFKHSDKTWPGGAKLKAEKEAEKKQASEKVSASSSVKDWYKKEFPDDTLGDDLTNVSFQDIYEGLKHGTFKTADYADDSVVRERIFQKIAEVKQVPYKVIYDQWMAAEQDPKEKAEQQAKINNALKGLYWVKDSKGNRITNDEAKDQIKENLNELDKLRKEDSEITDAADKFKNQRKEMDLENENQQLYDKLNPEDRREMKSEAEKHQNRSQAMMGNKNAYKGGYSDDEISKMKEIRDKVSDYFKKKKMDVKPNSSAFEDKLIDMAHRSKDKEVEDMCRALRSFDGKTPDEFQKQYEERIVQALHDNKDFSFEENVAAEVGQNSDYWAAHIDDRPSQGLIEMATLLKLAQDHVTEKDITDKQVRRGFSGAVQVLTDMKKFAKNPEAFDEVINGYKELAAKFNPDAGKEEKKEIKEEVKAKEPENPVKETEKEEPETPKAKVHRYSPAFTPTEKSDASELKPVGSNRKIGEGKVELEYSKATANEIKQLLNSVSDDSSPSRRFLTKVYYQDGNLVATDSRRLKIVKVGELDGIENGSFVNITNGKDGITIEKDENKENFQFPDYKRIIPQSNNQKIVLDNNALKDKIRSLKEEGGWSTRDPMITLDIKDGNLMLDGVRVGDARDAHFEGKNTDYINMNAEYLLNALSGDSSNLMCNTDQDKPMTIGTTSSENIIMPMTKTKREWDSNGKRTESENKVDYQQKKDSKKAEDERKSQYKQRMKDQLNEFVDGFSNNFSQEKIQSYINQINDKNSEKHEAVVRHTYEALKKAEKMINNPTSKYDESMGENRYGYMTLAIAKKSPEFRTALENMAKEYGFEVKKSLFELFDSDEIDEEPEEEPLWNENDASSPELFNNPSYNVAEVLSECFC